MITFARKSKYLSQITVILILFFSVLTVGGLTFTFQHIALKYKHYITAFGVAFVLSLICLHLLPEVFESNVNQVGIYLLLGFVFQLILELFSRGIEHGHVHDSQHNHSVNRTLLAMLFGLSLHSFIEGIPLFILDGETVHTGHEHLAMQPDLRFSNVFLWAIVGHKIPVSIVLMLFLLQAELKKRQVLLLFLLFSLMSPLGAVAGILLHSANWLGEVSTILLAITTGMLMHITTLLVFEEYHHQQDKLKNILLIVAGIGLGVLIF